MSEYPAVPLGALGFESPSTVAPPAPPRAPRPWPARRDPMTRGRDGRLVPILGGAKVERQLLHLLQREVRLGRIRLMDQAEEQAGRAWWLGWSRDNLESLMGTLGKAVPRHADETVEAWRSRLEEVAGELGVVTPVTLSPFLSKAVSTDTPVTLSPLLTQRMRERVPARPTNVRHAVLTAQEERMSAGQLRAILLAERRGQG